ncbi:unnamed protein product [Echinostoma caproni]|uniref:DUF5753 domain-containing protein n=1 Tax=Echinostoma caproni TaxID=27848 RepID=A0A183B9G8_9TREM|nr:unnamed protein product [Echinostoma caproni]
MVDLFADEHEAAPPPGAALLSALHGWDPLFQSPIGLQSRSQVSVRTQVDGTEKIDRVSFVEEVVYVDQRTSNSL